MQCFERHKAGLREDDEPFDPARCFGKAPRAALSTDPVADGQLPAVDADL